MAEKVLPAKGAKALLEAVGFAQAPGHAVLVMQGRDVDAALLGAAAEGLQRLLGEKEQREAERRQQAVAKNREVSAKMRTTQAADRERKAALGETIKRQQLDDQREREASRDGAAAPDMSATQALQQLYTGKGAAAGRAGGGRAAGGLITVRIVSPDGQDNVQLPQSATFGDLRAKIASELGVPEAVQVIGLDRGCTNVVSSDRAKLKAKGITNGALVGLKYPGFTREGKVRPAALPTLPPARQFSRAARRSAVRFPGDRTHRGEARRRARRQGEPARGDAAGGQDRHHAAGV